MRAVLGERKLAATRDEMLLNSNNYNFTYSFSIENRYYGEFTITNQLLYI
jgi:hypothetical protein